MELEEGPGAWKKFGPICSCNQYGLEYVGCHPLAGFCVAWCSDGQFDDFLVCYRNMRKSESLGKDVQEVDVDPVLGKILDTLVVAS